jgi:hypothetical protein
MFYQKNIVVGSKLFVLILLVFTVTSLRANVITSGCAATNLSCTLDELAGGGSIIVDNILFDSWVINDFSSTTTNLSLIEVLALDDQPLSSGLQFNTNGEFSVVGFDVIDFSIGFTVSTLDLGARIRGNNLEINDFAFDPMNIGGFIDIWEDVLDVNGDLLGDEFVTADNFSSTFELYDSATFNPNSQVFIEKTIFLSGDDQLDKVSLDSFNQRFIQVPEPSTLWLMVFGLAVFFARKK